MNSSESPDVPKPDSNPDPVTGEPGAHPIATGIGAAGAGTVATVIGGVLGGPVGAVIGAAVGAMVGGYAGKATGEIVDPSAEEAYWRANHHAQSYANQGAYEDFDPAYRTGFEGPAPTADRGNTFEEIEDALRQNYEVRGSTLSWDKVRAATRAAWLRAHQHPEAMTGASASVPPTAGPASENVMSENLQSGALNNAQTPR